MKTTRLKTQVLIIGAGATGTGLARDLALRGIQNILVDQGDVNSGASGANHGLLHSGARYVASNPHSAKECQSESALLKRLAPQCIESCGGLFVAVQGDDEQYIADFPNLCAQCNIPVKAMSAQEAKDMEPALSPKLIAAYQVPDGAIDPFQLSLANLAQAKDLGTRFFSRTQVIHFSIQSGHPGQIVQVKLWQADKQKELNIAPEIVINAAGAWAGKVASLGGIHIPMIYSKGTILVTQERMSSKVINRLRHPADGDILVPGGIVSLLGTTSVRIPDLRKIRPTPEEADQIINQGQAMLPVLGKARYIRSYAGVRPLVGNMSKDNDRSLERDLVLLDHEQDGLHNFITITGGKLTTYRLMAEKTADLVCKKLKIKAKCLTKKIPLPSSNESIWTTPGLAPKTWHAEHDPNHDFLCECELIPEKIIRAITTSLPGHKDTLISIGLRTRLGKGPCQGTCCGFRTAAFLAKKKQYSSNLQDMKDFLEERWKGERPVLWGTQLIQAELKEAFYCGSCSLEQAGPGEKK